MNQTGFINGEFENGKENNMSQTGFINGKILKFKENMYKWILFALVFFILGTSAGIYGSSKYFKYKMNDIVLLKGFIHESVVYNVNVRP